MTFKEAALAYEQTKIQIKELETKLEELKPTVLAGVPEDSEVALEHGSLYVQKKAKWTYSEEVQMLEKTVKERKKEEEAKGFATAEYSDVLVYKTSKGV